MITFNCCNFSPITENEYEYKIRLVEGKAKRMLKTSQTRIDNTVHELSFSCLLNLILMWQRTEVWILIKKGMKRALL